jgi:hypothetical protein
MHSFALYAVESWKKGKEDDNISEECGFGAFHSDICEDYRPVVYW